MGKYTIISRHPEHAKDPENQIHEFFLRTPGWLLFIHRMNSPSQNDTLSDSSAVSTNTFSDIGIAPSSQISSITVNSSRRMAYFSHSFSRMVESSGAGSENSRKTLSSLRSISSHDSPVTTINSRKNVNGMRSSRDMRNILSFRHYSYQVLLFSLNECPIPNRHEEMGFPSDTLEKKIAFCLYPIFLFPLFCVSRRWGYL